MTADQILSLFPHKEGVYRLFPPCVVGAATNIGWLAISVIEDGRVLMWSGKGGLDG